MALLLLAACCSTPVPTTFEGWTNHSARVGMVTRTIARGTREWPVIARTVDVEVIRSLVSEAEADQIVGILANAAFDRDEDTVDSMRTFEFYLEKSGTAAALATINGKPDRLPRVMAHRKPLRAAVANITRPIIEERLLPWLRTRFPSPPGGSPLQLCFSFIRRYMDGERKTHKAHFDLQAYATAVVSLKSAGREFDGGLYVSASGDGAREWIALQKGDAVIHQSDLLHGVDVTRGERWSWVMWFKPALTAAACPRSDLASWHVRAAEEGDPVAQFLTARRSRSPRDANKWLQRSADAGFTRAENELGAAHLFGTGGRPKDVAKATELLERAAPYEADAAFNLGLAALGGTGGGGRRQSSGSQRPRQWDLSRRCPIWALRIFAARGGFTSTSIPQSAGSDAQEMARECSLLLPWLGSASRRARRRRGGGRRRPAAARGTRRLAPRCTRGRAPGRNGASSSASLLLELRWWLASIG